MTSSELRVVIVEDHALTRAGLRTTLEREFAVVAESANGPDGLATILRERPDVAVIDLGLPGMDGIALTQAVREGAPQTHVVILTMLDDGGEVLAALAAGADAYCLKSSPMQRILDAVRVAGEGGAYFDPHIAHVVLARFHPGHDAHRDSPLSAREAEILRLVSDGVGNVEIGERLHVGLGTVKGHIRDILEKLKANDRTQAAVVALRRGYI
ncbi:MAG TPA: response regulator transcription factor [Verrucomicrobiae bacterium]|jgi:DNA-binding NarL/FixJ family response regulator|nr:response regulator transcription factor [Verrucomicrobiae bacterium]